MGHVTCDTGHGTYDIVHVTWGVSMGHGPLEVLGRSIIGVVAHELSFACPVMHSALPMSRWRCGGQNARV